MGRILVTGANGFIGSHLVEHLVRRGDRVTGLIKSGTGPRSLTRLVEPDGDRLRMIVGDLRDRDALAPALDDVAYVYHLGAVVVGASEAEFRDANVTGTRNLLEALAGRSPGRLRRFLFVSSQAAAGPSPDGTPIDESRPPQPVSWYGESKRDAEAIVSEFGRTLPVTIVRPVKVYGERERGFSQKVIAMVRAGLAPRLGLGPKAVCLIYVTDAVEGMIAAAESAQSLGKTYFLSGPRPYDQREVVRAIADAVGRRIRVPLVVPHALLWIVAVLAERRHRLTGARPVLTRDKVREMTKRYWAASPAAAARDFGWSARIGLEDGMARTVLRANHSASQQRSGRAPPAVATADR